MNTRTKIRKASNVAIFARNHKQYLERAAQIAREHPKLPVTFRASTIWRGAEIALSFHGPRKIYFVPVSGEKLVEYQAELQEVLIDPEIEKKRTKELLAHCLPETRDEGLWERYGEKVRTLYVIANCQHLAEPFPFSWLTKVSDDSPISEDYVYSYSIVYEFCQKCCKSPCVCSG